MRERERKKERVMKGRKYQGAVSFSPSPSFSLMKIFEPVIRHFCEHRSIWASLVPVKLLALGYFPNRSLCYSSPATRVLSVIVSISSLSFSFSSSLSFPLHLSLPSLSCFLSSFSPSSSLFSFSFPLCACVLIRSSEHTHIHLNSFNTRTLVM